MWHAASPLMRRTRAVGAIAYGYSLPIFCCCVCVCARGEMHTVRWRWLLRARIHRYPGVRHCILATACELSVAVGSIRDAPLALFRRSMLIVRIKSTEMNAGIHKHKAKALLVEIFHISESSAHLNKCMSPPTYSVLSLTLAGSVLLLCV